PAAQRSLPVLAELPDRAGRVAVRDGGIRRRHERQGALAATAVVHGAADLVRLPLRPGRSPALADVPARAGRGRTRLSGAVDLAPGFRRLARAARRPEPARGHARARVAGRRLRRQWRDRRGGPRDGGCAEDAVHASAGRGVAARRGPAGTGRRGRAADDRPRRGRRLATRAGCGARTRRGWCGGRRVPVAVRACARRATEGALPVRAGPQPVTPRWTRPPARRTPGRVCFLPGSSPIATKKECRMQSVIRSAAVAGTFYPAQPDALRSGIVRWLSE